MRSCREHRKEPCCEKVTGQRARAGPYSHREWLVGLNDS